MEKSSQNILRNIFFSVSHKKVSLERHEFSFFADQSFQLNNTTCSFLTHFSSSGRETVIEPYLLDAISFLNDQDKQRRVNKPSSLSNRVLDLFLTFE